MLKLLSHIQTATVIFLALITTSCSAMFDENKNETPITPKAEPQVASDSASHKAIETIYGFEVKSDSLWFLVNSNGCTSEKSFELNLDEKDHSLVLTTLNRTTRDLCRGLPKIISINMNLKGKNNIKKHYIVNNPFALKPIRR